MLLSQVRLLAGFNLNYLDDVVGFSSTRFVNSILRCVTPQCSSQDLVSAENVTQQFCNVASPNVTLSYPPLPTSSSSSSSSSSASQSSQGSSSSSSSSSGSTPSSSAGAGQSNGSLVNIGSPVATLLSAVCILVSAALAIGV